MDNMFVKAVISGMIAGVIKNIPNAILNYFPKLVEITLWDYAGTIALGRLPQNLGEEIYAFILEILFSIFLGICFINISFLNQYDHYKIKGILFGAFIWFTIRVGVLAFHIQPLLEESLGTSLTNLLVSMFYGCILACSIKMIDWYNIKKS